MVLTKKFANKIKDSSLSLLLKSNAKKVIKKELNLWLPPVYGSINWDNLWLSNKKIRGALMVNYKNGKVNLISDNERLGKGKIDIEGKFNFKRRGQRLLSYNIKLKKVPLLNLSNDKMKSKIEGHIDGRIYFKGKKHKISIVAQNGQMRNMNIMKKNTGSAKPPQAW